MKITSFGLALLFMMSFMLLYSVKTDAQVTYGIKAGANFASLTFTQSSAKKTSETISGLQAGAFVNFTLSPLFLIRPSLMYERKGGNLNTDIGGLNLDGKTRLDYLTLPVNLVLDLKAPGNATWLIGAGPYIGYGLYGNATTILNGTTYSDNPFEDNSSVGGASLKRLDAGADIQVDYKMANDFSIGINASLGLANIAANRAGAYPVRNTSFGAMLGYTFKKL